MLKSRILFVLFTVSLWACKSSSETCVAPALEKNIVGSWNATLKEKGAPDETGVLVFNADGTLKDAKSLLLGVAVPKITWKVTAAKVEVTFTEDAANFSTLTYTATENSCTKIILDLQFYTVELTK